MIRYQLFTAIALWGVSIAANGAELSTYKMPTTVPAPADNEVTAARVELGLNLFFDPRLSGSNWISCATCHNPALGWSDGLPTAIGNGMGVLGRHTPTVLNTAFQTTQFWDGRMKTLEQQALGPIVAPGEMNGDLVKVIEKLSAIKGYAPLFEAAYPGEGITKEVVGKAIASFERTVISTGSPFDKWAGGDEKAVTDNVKRGFALFEGKANCVACHSGFNFTDNGFHNIGLKGSDVGRYAVKKVASMQGAFKTPTLRNVTLSAPYMHDGSEQTLEAVIDFYDRGGDVKEHLDPNMKQLNLSAEEKADLLAFLASLTDEKPVRVTLPLLPM